MFQIIWQGEMGLNRSRSKKRMLQNLVYDSVHIHYTLSVEGRSDGL